MSSPRELIKAFLPPALTLLLVPAIGWAVAAAGMSKADGYIEIPAAVEVVDANELVEVKLF